MNGQVTISIEDYEKLLEAETNFNEQVKAYSEENSRLIKDKEELIESMKKDTKIMILANKYIVPSMYSPYAYASTSRYEYNTRIISNERVEKYLEKIFSSVVEKANERISEKRSLFRKPELLNVEDFKTIYID